MGRKLRRGSEKDRDRRKEGEREEKKPTRSKKSVECTREKPGKEEDGVTKVRVKQSRTILIDVTLDSVSLHFLLRNIEYRPSSIDPPIEISHLTWFILHKINNLKFRKKIVHK